VAIQWPEKLLKPQSVQADVAPRNLRGPTATNGFAQVVSNSAGLWRVVFENVPVYTREMIKTWRAIASFADGQANAILIPVYDWDRAPLNSGLTRQSFCANVDNVTHSDNSGFSDGSFYAQGYIDVRVAEAAGIGSTTLSVTKISSADLEPGQRFSITGRLYEIKSITSQTATTATIKLSLPLRESVDTYNYLDFARPRLKVRLASDNEMHLPLNFNRQGFKSLEFIEYL